MATSAVTFICACGCGMEGVSVDKHRRKNRPKRYIQGHSNFQRRGQKQSDEWVKKKGDAIKAAWKDQSKFKTVRHQSPEYVEARISKIRGMKHPEEFGVIISERIKQAWADGKYNNAHWSQVGGPGASPEQMDKIRAMRDMDALKKMQRERMLGTHGKGKSARDNPQHFNALYWIIRDSRGVTHEFNNLQSWCRKNEWRFLPDERPMSKLKLWQRAVSGFNGMRRMDGKGQHTWRGWTLVSVLERKTIGCPDLLQREPTTPPPPALPPSAPS